MPLIPVIDSRKLREAAAAVKEIDPQIRKDLLNNLRADLLPYAEQIANAVPNPPLSGFSHRGRTGWSRVKASVHVTPGGGKGSVARIEIFGTAKRAAFKLADLVGTRNRGDRIARAYERSPSRRSRGAYIPEHSTRAGDVLIQRMTQRYPLSASGRGGRFAWSGFMKHRPRFLAAVISRLDVYSQKIADRISK
jgi:hypothetical protein